jgi:predicted DNA-binding antitoxin AbrB/MazE fold protein
MTVRAIFANGVFRPRETVALPEHTEVDLEIAQPKRPYGVNLSPGGMEKIYEIMSITYDDPSSPGDIAERHNEHQP